MKQRFLAILARIAGKAGGRPHSGKWLAHYLKGSGLGLSLPPELEEDVLRLFWSMIDCPTQEWVVLEPPNNWDLYTVLGGFSVWCHNGLLWYEDDYDWHEGNSFEFLVNAGPFRVCVSSRDALLSKMGVPFLTSGRIVIVPIEDDTPSACVGGGLNTSYCIWSMRFTIRKWKRRIVEGILSLLKE